MEAVEKATDRLAETTDDELAAIWNDVGAIDRLMSAVLEDIQWIEVQIKEPNRTTTDGERVSNHDWWNWRHRAVGARTHKLHLYRKLKARRKELNVAQYNRVHDEHVEARAIRVANNETTAGLLTRIADTLDRIEALLRDEAVPA